jgi:crotonobetainyl-CoA:carnitine CoA-transferase CaiB-like acyl-CoA transferase
MLSLTKHADERAMVFRNPPLPPPISPASAKLIFSILGQPEWSAPVQPLNDIRVLAVTVFLAGPFLSMNLARFGAEVIKVEVPGDGDSVRGLGPFAGPEGVHPTQQTDLDLPTKFLKRTQGVKSVTLNLKDPEGKRLFLELAKQSDVVIENLSPGSMKRLGLDYDAVASVNPGIVYCSISGYGQTGPYAGNPAHDHQIQAMSGMMDINGDPDGPPTRVGVYVSDLVTPLYAAYSIMAALRHREQTGEGQYLDASMMDTLATLMFMEPLEEALAEGQPIRAGNDSRTNPSGVYRVKDADIFITVTNDARWAQLCEAMDAPDLHAEARFATAPGRAEHLEDLRREIQQRLGRLTCADAVARLEAADVPVAPVRTLDEVLADEHFYRRGTLKPMRHGALDDPVAGHVVVGYPIVFSSGPLPDLSGAPALGKHNEDVFGRLLGLDAGQIGALRDKGVV